ncbi:PREDICTED: RNA-binding protein 44 isoform X1 [Cyprinodon variegatus]|uniref:RNA-binding protein 44 isoform X1 n=2 Tax=Cyprinodon variegatus TaxID=28743 RepID=UPI0007424ECF|nr:PREDICTED: RNA-binding protein 44 isoform X1 [Cyprinodon variegatus]
MSNLPGNTAETDQKQKFQPSDVSISTLKNKARDAMVDASEAAAGRELSGHQIQNYTISISHNSGAIDGNQSSSSVSKQDAIEASPSENEPIDSPLLGFGTQRWRVVSNSLTGRKTYVPLHFGTMDSLRILMGELTQMHPDVGRQGVMDALMELKTRHGGALGSLPLSTIRDMTSDLLTKSAPATQT